MHFEDKKLISYIILLLIALHVSAKEEMIENKTLYDLPIDCDFLAIGNNDSIEYDCSPKLTDRFFSDFKGILINTQSEIIWPDNASKDDCTYFPNGNNNSPFKLMLAGLAHVPDSVIKNNLDIAFEVLIVAVDQKTAQSYSGKMIKLGSIGAIPELEPDVGDDVSPDITRKNFFNIDLVENLGLPISNATYIVYATLGEYKSNVMTVGTRIKK